MNQPKSAAISSPPPQPSAKAKTQHDQGEFAETSRVRFAQWLDEWLTGREQRGDIKQSTLDNYRRYVAQAWIVSR